MTIRKFLINRMLVVSVLLVLSNFLTASHKFYVSLTEIRIVQEKGIIEISMRIYPDDLDLALEELHGINPQVATRMEHKNADRWVADYVMDNFSVCMDGKSLHLSYVGKEAESDVLWCYFEARLPSSFSKIRIRNTVLIDEFRDQKNIIQVYYNEFNKGLLLDEDTTEGSIDLNDN